MYKQIMMPVDLGRREHLDKALAVAGQLASLYRAPVCYVAIAEETPGPVAHNPAEYEAELARFAAEQAERHGISTSCRVIASVDVAVEKDRLLQKACKDLNADLIIMPSHTPGLADQLHLSGSNAAWLVRHTEVSVFVVR